MAELVLHDLDPDLLRQLNALASKSGRSVEQEAKRMLEESLGVARERAVEAARRIRESHGRTFSDSADLIRREEFTL
jgi:plasmid stability protein